MLSAEEILADEWGLVGSIPATLAPLLANRPPDCEAIEKIEKLAALVEWWKLGDHEMVRDPIRHLRNAFDDMIRGRGRVDVSLEQMADPGNADDPIHQILLAVRYAQASIDDLYRPEIDPEPFAGWPAEWRAVLPLSTKMEYAAGHYGYRMDNFLFYATQDVLAGVVEDLHGEDLRVPIAGGIIELMESCTARLSGWDDSPYQGDEIRYRWGKDDPTRLVHWATWCEDLERGFLDS